MLLHVKVKPNQSKDRLEKVGDEWQIKLRARATEGKANQQLIEFLSGILNISKSKIRLLKGQTSRIKCLEIEGDEVVVLKMLEKNLK